MVTGGVSDHGSEDQEQVTSARELVRVAQLVAAKYGSTSRWAYRIRRPKPTERPDEDERQRPLFGGAS